MKIPTLFASVAVLSALSLQADPPPPPSEQAPPPPHHGPPHPSMKMLKDLPPELRKRFDDAREKALQDPAVRALKEKMDTSSREFFEAMRTKMQEIDPGLGEMVKEQVGWKHRKSKGDKDGQGGDRGKDRGKRPDGAGKHPHGFGVGVLTDAERQQLMDARTKAKNDPAVQAAEEKKKAAKSPAERAAASEEYRKAMREALIKADPSLEPILNKLPAPVPPGGPKGDGAAKGGDAAQGGN